MFAIGSQLVSPRIALLFKPAAGGELPLGFRGQAFLRPICILRGIVPRHMNGRVMPPRIDSRPRPFRIFPIRAVHAAPPFHAGSPILHQFWRHVRVEYERPAEPLGLRFVSGFFDEPGKFFVGDWILVNAKRIQCHLAHRPLAIGRKCIQRLCAHQEWSPIQLHHVFHGSAPRLVPVLRASLG